MKHFLRTTFVRAAIRAAFCSSVALCALMFSGCSDEDEGTEPEPEQQPTTSTVIVPDNGNMPSSGEIVCEFSDSPAGSDAGKLVDGDPATQFSLPKTVFYLTWKGDEPAVVNTYTLTAGCDLFCSPRQWTLQGSNDGTSWTTLDEVDGNVFTGARVTNTYRMDNATAYTYYRLQIQANNGGKSTEIAEWTMGFIDSSNPHSVEVADSEQLPGSGVLMAQYSDYPVGSDISAIVDGDNSTSYQTAHSSFHITWAGNEAATAWMYELTSSVNDAANDPKSWTFSGSNDQTEWVPLDEQTGRVFERRNQTLRFVLSATGTYKYYRLEVTENNGGSATQIAEFGIGHESPHSVEVAADGVMPTAGVLTAQYSDYLEGADISAIVDDDPNTRYYTGTDKFYITWEGEEPCEAWMYSLTSSGSGAEDDPQSWNFYGSNDGSEWTMLDSQLYQEFPERRQTVRYQVPEENVGSYKYYKLEITGNHGGDATQIAEYSLFVYPTSYDHLSDRFNYIRKLEDEVMGELFVRPEVNREATAEQKAWLEDPAQEPDASSNAGFTVEFDVDLYPYGDPKPSDINQHDIGNCGVVASLAGLAYQYPRYIKEYLIRQVSPQHFIVNMFDPRGKEIEVAVSNKFMTKTGSTQLMHTSGKAQGDNKRPANWGTVLEKALMKYKQVYFGSSGLGGWMGDRALPPFLGLGDTFNGAGYKSFALTIEELETVFKVALSKGEMVTVGFVSVDGSSDILLEGESKIILNHAFTVMQTANPSCIAAVRNPWGSWSGAEDGIVNIPMSDLVARSINFQVIRPGRAGTGEWGPVGTRKPYEIPLLPAAVRAVDDANFYQRMQEGIH